MTEQEIRAVFDKLADVVCVLSEAAPNGKPEISCQLDLKLTYQPGEKNRGSEDRTCFPWFSESVRGPRPANWAWWRNCSDQVFCCWWCPVMAADRVISLTTAVPVSEGVATAAVLD
jgi:hypothetical protein